MCLGHFYFVNINVHLMRNVFHLSSVGRSGGSSSSSGNSNTGIVYCSESRAKQSLFYWLLLEESMPCW